MISQYKSIIWRAAVVLSKIEACNWIQIFSAFLALVLVYFKSNFS